MSAEELSSPVYGGGGARSATEGGSPRRLQSQQVFVHAIEYQIAMLVVHGGAHRH